VSIVTLDDEDDEMRKDVCANNTWVRYM